MEALDSNRANFELGCGKFGLVFLKQAGDYSLRHDVDGSIG